MRVFNFFSKFLVFLFPWIYFLIHDNPGGALVALMMQASIIGWFPASIWALRVMREKEELAAKSKRPA